MIDNLVGVAIFIAVLLLVYRFQHQIVAALRRFDQQNVKRIRDQEAEKADPLAHFKHTLRTAEEQVEAVSEISVLDERLGTPVTRYVFEGQHFGTRQEADNARAEKIRAIARGYYMELPVALAERRGNETLH